MAYFTPKGFALVNGEWERVPGAPAPFKENQVSSQIYTRVNTEYGLAVTVTRISKGYAVTFIDHDSGNLIETRIYQDEAAAIAYAEKLIAQESRGGAVLI